VLIGQPTVEKGIVHEAAGAGAFQVGAMACSAVGGVKFGGLEGLLGFGQTKAEEGGGEKRSKSAHGREIEQ